MDDNDKAGVAEGGVREAILMNDAIFMNNDDVILTILMNDNENENGLVI